MRYEQQVKALQQAGLIVGERDPQRNIAFRGAFMVAEPIDPGLLPTESARTGGYCVVGDNLPALVAEAVGYWELVTA